MSDRDPLRSLLAVGVALAALVGRNAYAQAAQHHDALPKPVSRRPRAFFKLPAGRLSSNT